LAGHQKLDRLIVVFDDNRITIDGSTDLTCSDDVAQRFSAYGWDVTRLGPISEDLDALEKALMAARNAGTERPQLLILPTKVGFPSPDWTDRHEAHGNPFTAEDVLRTKEVMGIPPDSFWAPNDIVSACRDAASTVGHEHYQAWSHRLAQHQERELWDATWLGHIAGWHAHLPVFTQGDSIATRVAIQKTFDAVLSGLPGLVAGSADLTGNTGTKLSGQDPMSASSPGGRQIYFGIREHAMGAAMVGMALHGGVLPVGGTFFVFFDYMKPSVRLAAISGAKCLFVFTHDSVGVGEDGPTHQPIEHLAALRSIPDLQVIRPADANETAAALQAAIEFPGPTALVLSRQNVPVITDGSAVSIGAGVLRVVAQPDVVLVATGSEVQVALRAADTLHTVHGRQCQVVSLPSWDRFEKFRLDHPEDAEAILPSSVPTVSIEAGTTFGWERYADRCIGIDRFGASAPGALALENLGINDQHVVQVTLDLLGTKP
jgi:transketolase